MRHAVLSLALLAPVFTTIAGRASAAPAAPAASPASPGEGEEMGLLADFVEVGRVDRSVARDVAMVDLLNLSPHVLDVVVGQAAGTLQPKERIIARVAAGDQNVTVTSREKGVPQMEGRLHLDGGVRYELALAYGPVPKVKAEVATPGIDTEPAPGGAAIAPMPKEAAPAAPRPERRSKGGRVDIGRRRK